MFLNYLTDLFAFDNAHPLLFTQFNFWAFFLLVYALFCAIVEVGSRERPFSKGRRLMRNGYLFLVSLFFYYKTSGLFVLLLIFATLVGWILGIRMDSLRTGGKRKMAKALMILGVVVNLLVLSYFKYAYFFTDIYNTVFHTHLEAVNVLARWSNHFTATARFDASVILLPVGISFFTFQNISYIVDVYKGKVRHASNVLDFGFYTTFFPQLVAGPIVRADQFIPQLYKPFFLTRRQFGIALFWILNGLAKKLIVADYLAVNFVDRVFDNPSLYTPFENFASLLVYSLQVYADFSGYTDIAIGVAMLMGFYLPLNFNSPYKATNPAGFWKRWHISLSNWLKDYLYIPIGGNRNATVATYLILAIVMAVVGFMANTLWVWIVIASVATLLVAVYILFPKHRREMNTNINNMDTMLLGGLWHGASFNFITWGGLNGLGILAYKWWKKLGPWARIIAIMLIFIAVFDLRLALPSHTMNFFVYFTGFATIGILLVTIPRLFKHQNTLQFEARNSKFTLVWNTLLTFLFISFTRLFFRSGSNLNPAEANEVAWRTASQMVDQMGSHWNLAQIPQIVGAYWNIFLIFAIGMVIHWLPARFKRRYRLWFASMPIWLMLLVVVAAVFVLYQFVTAGLQPFIYFQF